MKYEIVNIRPYGKEIAVDILWTHEDGGFVREHVSHVEERDGKVVEVEDASGKSIADMLLFVPPLDEVVVLATIEDKRPIIEHEVELFRKTAPDIAIHLASAQTAKGLIGKKG